MKSKLTVLLLVLGLIVSCSTDSNDESMQDDQVAMEDDGMMDDDATDDSADDMSDDTTDDSPDDVFEGDLIGLWTLSDIRFDETLNNDDLEFAQEIIRFLIEQECYLFTFNFLETGMVDSESKANYIEISVGAGGLEIPCPEESDLATSLWALDGDQLTFINDEEEEETLTIVFENENTFIIEGSAIDENNYDGAEAVFIRLEEEE